MAFNIETKINTLATNDMDRYGSFTKLKDLPDELNNVYGSKVIRIKEISKSGIILNDDAIYPILAVFFIISAFIMAFNFTISIICWVIIVIGLIYRKIKIKNIEPTQEKEQQLFYKQINQIEKDFKNRINQVLSKNNISLRNIKNAELIESNINDYARFLIQLAITKDKITILSLPIDEVKIVYGNFTYNILVWNKNEEVLVNSYNENEIEDYTYYGETISKTNVSGGGTDYGGALLGGFLFGGVGAIIGSREDIKVDNEIVDLREVQINFKNSKMINVKGFELFKELSCYFPKKRK